MQKIFLLGADDPEMKAMTRLLIVCGALFSYAFVEGQRATPGNSYRADPVDIPDDLQLVVVECAFEDMPDSVIVVDHHRPGDPGFALGPDRFWEASSIGQLHKLLGIEPDHDAVVMAAFDHCFAIAARGGCAGVTAEEVIHLRIGEIAKQTGRSGADIWQLVLAFRRMLTQAPELAIGDQSVKDFRKEYLGEGYSLRYLAAQLAATMNGHVAILRHRDHVRGEEKNTITGHASAATIKEFIRTWAPQQGLDRIFGVPDRGYAGGFVSRRHSSRTA
jgi:hypothetical protein